MARYGNSFLRFALFAAVAASAASPGFAQGLGDDGGAPRPPGPAAAAPPPPPALPPGAVPPKRKHHGNGDVGVAIGAGVVGGLVGGALLNRGGQAPGYPAQPAYAPPPPPPPTADYDVEDEPVCRLVRKPVYDEDGEIVDYRTRRICR